MQKSAVPIVLLAAAQVLLLPFTVLAGGSLLVELYARVFGEIVEESTGIWVPGILSWAGWVSLCGAVVVAALRRRNLLRWAVVGGGVISAVTGLLLLRPMSDGFDAVTLVWGGAAVLLGGLAAALAWRMHAVNQPR